MPRNGRSAASQARIGSTRPRRSSRAIAGAGRADARDDERVGAAQRLRVADDANSAPTVVSAWSMLTRLPAP